MIRRRHRTTKKKTSRISSALRVYTSVIVAYAQSVRENAISNPAPTAGANVKSPPAFELSMLLPCRTALFLRRGAAKQEAVTSTSATTRVSIAQASAAKTADEKLIRTATFPTGTSDARCASMTHSGVPGGCATPSPYAAKINSPLSVRVTVGASVKLYTTSAARNTAPAQTNSAREENGLVPFASCTGFVAFWRWMLLAVRRAICLSSRKLAWLQTIKAMRGRQR